MLIRHVTLDCSQIIYLSMQVRIGNMDGVLVAYHNTARVFGFQYVPLEEMDSCLFGGKGRGDRVFQKCVGLLEEVADEITRTFPEQVGAPSLIWRLYTN